MYLVLNIETRITDLSGLPTQAPTDSTNPLGVYAFVMTPGALAAEQCPIDLYSAGHGAGALSLAAALAPTIAPEAQ